MRQEALALQEYNKLYEMEIMEMKKRVEEEWIIYGDRCSKVFHKILKSKKNCLIICQIQNDKGILCSTQPEIAEFFEQSFKQSLGTDNTS